MLDPKTQPANRDPNHITYFAATNFRGANQKFGIRPDDRRRHMYVIGKTGMGKSTLLENMIIQDIQDGHGLAVVDPHGDLAEKVLDYIPSNRIEDVVYLNPADLQHPIAFNILENVDPAYTHLIANGLVGVFKKIWADSWGPRLEYILQNTILALLECPGSTLLGVTRMLVDPGYRKKVLRTLKDPVVRSFWVNEFNNYSEKFRNEAIAPIQNKVGQFLSSALIRNIVGQEKSTIDIRRLMDEEKIIIMNLSKGRVGEENAALLGAMMITKIQLAAMSRVDMPESERRDFYLYVDEFQNFATESFAGILSEARKYRLDLIMAHQYIEQLSDEVRAAVFGNVGTMLVFRVGGEDAEYLLKEFQPTFTEDHIVALPAYQVYLRLMINGVASEPFSANTLPPIEGKTNNREAVIEFSRSKYANDRTVVEGAISDWAADVGQMVAATAKAGSEYSSQDRNQPSNKDRKNRAAEQGDNDMVFRDERKLKKDKTRDQDRKPKSDQQSSPKPQQDNIPATTTQGAKTTQATAPTLKTQSAPRIDPSSVPRPQQPHQLAPVPKPAPAPSAAGPTAPTLGIPPAPAPEPVSVVTPSVPQAAPNLIAPTSVEPNLAEAPTDRSDNEHYFHHSGVNLVAGLTQSPAAVIEPVAPAPQQSRQQSPKPLVRVKAMPGVTRPTAPVAAPAQPIAVKKQPAAQTIINPSALPPAAGPKSESTAVAKRPAAPPIPSASRSTAPTPLIRPAAQTAAMTSTTASDQKPVESVPAAPTKPQPAHGQAPAADGQKKGRKRKRKRKRKSTDAGSNQAPAPRQQASSTDRPSPRPPVAPPPSAPPHTPLQPGQSVHFD